MAFEKNGPEGEKSLKATKDYNDVSLFNRHAAKSKWVFSKKVASEVHIGAEVTIFTSSDGTLTKTVSLKPNGALHAEPACMMKAGIARRHKAETAAQLADLIDDTNPNQALATGRLRLDLDDDLAERLDPRPMIGAPEDDAPWLPEVSTLNDVVGRSALVDPPARDGGVTVPNKTAIPGTHAFTSDEANEEE